MRTVRPRTSVVSAFSPSAKRFSALSCTTRPAPAGSSALSNAMRCESSSGATGSSSSGTHHTNAARRVAGGATPAGCAGSGSRASGPFDVKRSTARSAAPPSSDTWPTHAVCR